jgi:hypothetical protein
MFDTEMYCPAPDPKDLSVGTGRFATFVSREKREFILRPLLKGDAGGIRSLWRDVFNGEFPAGRIGLSLRFSRRVAFSHRPPPAALPGPGAAAGWRTFSPPFVFDPGGTAICWSREPR